MSPTISYYDRNSDHIDTHYFPHDFIENMAHAERLADDYWPHSAVEARIESLDFSFELYLD